MHVSSPHEFRGCVPRVPSLWGFLRDHNARPSANITFVLPTDGVCIRPDVPALTIGNPLINPGVSLVLAQHGPCLSRVDLEPAGHGIDEWLCLPTTRRRTNER